MAEARSKRQKQALWTGKGECDFQNYRIVTFKVPSFQQKPIRYTKKQEHPAHSQGGKMDRKCP